MSTTTQPTPSSSDPLNLAGGLTDTFFTPLANTNPYFKVGAQGFAGSGKTHTIALIAKGLHDRLGSTKPVVIFDTEKSAKFLKPLFGSIPVLVKESRSLADLKSTMQRAADGVSDIVIIDSLSHVWEDFCEAYKRKFNRKRLEMLDWGIVKPAWKKEFSDPFVQLPIHILFTGRAGYEYDSEINSETGKREIYKSGVKMKVEGETAYEPDILFLMERFEEIVGKDDKKVWREATVLKDRSTLLDGKTFKNPSFSDFAPAVDAVLADPSKKVDMLSHQADQLFETDQEKREYLKQKDIVIEKIEAFMVKNYPGQTAEIKKEKLEAIEKCFGSTSWTEITGMSLSKLESGYTALHSYTEELLKAKAEKNRADSERTATDLAAKGNGKKEKKPEGAA